MKNFNNTNGITLIALILTMIIILILTAATINAVNEGRLFSYANNAATSYSAAAREENSIIAGYLFKLNGSQPKPHSIYYNTPYVFRGTGTYNNQERPITVTFEINTDNSISVTNLYECGLKEGEGSGSIYDGFGGRLVTTKGGNEELIISSIEYLTDYTGYNSLGLPVTVWYNNAGENWTMTIPGAIVDIDTGTRTIDIGNGAVTGTYSIDGKTINLAGRTFVIE